MKELFSKTLVSEVERKLFNNVFYVGIYDRDVESDREKFVNGIVDTLKRGASWVGGYDVVSFFEKNEGRSREIISKAVDEYAEICAWSGMKPDLFHDLVDDISERYPREHVVIDVINAERERLESSGCFRTGGFSEREMDVYEFFKTYDLNDSDSFTKSFFHYLGTCRDEEGKRILFLEKNGVFVSVVGIKKYDFEHDPSEGPTPYSITFVSTHSLLQGKGFARKLLDFLYQKLVSFGEDTIKYSYFSEHGKALKHIAEEYGEKYGIRNVFKDY